MTYDPRNKGLAEGLYPERTGKTTRVVADLAARDALTDKYDGLLVQVLDSRKLYSWDAANATWDTVTGGSGIAKFATLADMQAATGMTDGDYATTLDTDKLYRYTDGAWVEFIAGSGGGGVAKYDTINDILAIVNPEECDLAIARDSGIMMEFHNGAWVTANNAMTDPQAGGNWELVDCIRCVLGTVPTTSFDISGCKKFKAKMVVVGAPTGNFGFSFDGDVTAAYASQDIYGQNTSAAASRTTRNSLFTVGSAYINGYSEIEFDKRAKTGMLVWQYGKVLSDVNAVTYTGSAAMNTLTPIGTGSFNGYIEVYKWVENSKSIELVSYELVKEIRLTAQVLDETITVSGNVDSEFRIVADLQSSATSNLLITLNGDTTAANYPCEIFYGSGATPYAAANTNGGLYIGIVDTSPTYHIARISLESGNNRKALTHVGYASYAALVSSQWRNTTAVVTSLQLRTATSVNLTGTLRVYKLTKAQLVTTNPNLNTLWSKYINADTVEVQPGEVEINGAVMRVSSPKQVTLSGNLRTGLTEAANTLYYMYAVRPSAGSNPTFMFDTVAPLMDRYGNTVASFEDCTAKRAWFHPTLGLNYRWIGQVRNDASSNLLAFDKCMPGYWESAYTSFTANTLISRAHAFGKTGFTVTSLFKSSIADAYGHDNIPYFYQTVSYGTRIGSYHGASVAAKTTTSVEAAFAEKVFHHNDVWQTTGYCKLILTEA